MSGVAAKIVQGYFNVCLTSILEAFGKVYLTVEASEEFIFRHPFLADHVKQMNGLDVVILDISPNAVDKFSQTIDGILFEASIRGEYHFMKVDYSEMIGLGEPGNPHPYAVGTALLVAPGEGFILVKPEKTIAKPPAVEVEVEVKPSPPKLSIVR